MRTRSKSLPRSKPYFEVAPTVWPAVDVAQPVMLAAAALIAGAVNAVAGGGSFFTFPALVLVGVPPVSANATSAVALWPASIASAVAFKDDVEHTRGVLLRLGVISLAGGLAGALLLLLTPEQAFARAVPWLLLAATLVFAFGSRLTRRFLAHGTHAPFAVVALVQAGISTYGGYFGGGMGIMMLAAFSALGMTNLHAMNGLKALLGVGINGVAVVAFIVAGVVHWPFALLMLAGGIAGGWGGARISRRIDPRWTRGFVIAVGFALSAYFFVAGV